MAHTYRISKLRLGQSRGASPLIFIRALTKEDSSSYPPWMLHNAPSEVTCIDYWPWSYG